MRFAFWFERAHAVISFCLGKLLTSIFVPSIVDAEPILKWIQNKRGQIPIGGKLTEELSNTPLRRLLTELLRSGIAIQYPASALTDEAKVIKKSALCVSNDVHIIALARISGSRLLYSKDKDLQKDFKNLKLLWPKGKIYSKRRNEDLLLTCPACKDP